MNKDTKVIDVAYSMAIDNNAEHQRDKTVLRVLNSNDYVVLSSVRQPNRGKGFGECEAKGVTKDMLVEKSNLSKSTVHRAVQKLLKAGLIKEAIKQVNKKAYYLSAKGIERLREIRETEW